MAKAVQLISENGPDSTIIDCQFADRAFIFNQSGEGASTLIQGFTITNARSTTTMHGQSPEGGQGGAVYLTGSSPTFRQCVFYKNGASDRGGAIYVMGSSATWDDCDFVENGARSGGAIYCAFLSHIYLQGCRFIRNNGNSGGGGAILIEDAVVMSATIDQCEFWENSGVGGGAIKAMGPCTISRTLFCGNSAASDGGAISSGNSGALQARNCTFVLNSATEGSSIWCSIYPASAQLTNCIVAYGLSGAAVVTNGGYVALACSNLFGNAGGDWVGSISGQATQNGNFSLDPVFCDTSADNFHLHNSSPCLPSNNSCDSLVGALSLGCSPTIDNVRLLNIPDLTHVTVDVPEIAWEYHNGLSLSQTHYQVQVSNDSDWSIPEMWDSGSLTGSDFAVTYAGLPLSDGQTYWLRVRVSDSIHWSLWDALGFRMNSIPGIPAPRTPASNGIAGNLTPALTIHNSTDTESDSLLYTFEVSPDNFATTLFTFTKTQDADSLTTLIVDSTLVENAQYWWRVKASDYYEQSTYSEIRSFFVNATNTAPTAFALSSPDSGLAIPLTTLLPQFTWLSSSDPDPLDSVRYTFFIATDQHFNFTKQITGLMNTSFTLTDSLTWATRYWWKVRANDLNGGSTWSTQVFTFRTMTLGDADGDGSVTIADVVFFINYIFMGGAAPQPVMAGDPNCDGSINIADAVYLINYIFSHGLPPCAGSSNDSTEAYR